MPMYFGQTKPTVVQVKERGENLLSDSLTFYSAKCPNCHESVTTIYEDTIYVDYQYGFRKLKVVRCRFGTKQIRLSNETINPEDVSSVKSSGLFASPTTKKSP